MTSTTVTDNSIELRDRQSLSSRRSSIDPSTPRLSSTEDEVSTSLVNDREAPDGGVTAWVVLACCSILSFWYTGISYSWGVMQEALSSEGLNVSTLNWVGSLSVSFIAFLSIVNARLIRTIGARYTAFLGVTFLGAGQILSSFTFKNIGGLFVTNGILLGIGTSLLFMVVSVTPSQWFFKRRGLSNGIVYASGGTGGAVISFLFDGLLQSLGTAWTFRAIGLLVLGTGLPAAWFIKERAPIRSATFIDVRLFRDLKFVLLFVASALGTFTLFVPPFFLPLLASSLGMSPSTGAALVACFNASSAIGRLGCGYACDKIGPVNTLLYSLVVSSISTLIIFPLASALGPLLLFAVVNGTANGGFFATVPSVVSSLWGSARLSVAMAMIVSGWSLGYLLGAPIAGYILAAFSGTEHGISAYRPAIFYAGSLATVAAAVLGFSRWKLDRRLLKRL